MVRFVRRVVWLCAAATVAWAATPAERYYRAAVRAERNGEMLRAYLLYGQAAALEPLKVAYVARRAALRPLVSLQSVTPPASDDGPLVAAVSAQDLEQARQALPPPRLKAAPERRSFDIRGDARSIFEHVLQAYGLLVMFEADYQPPPSFRFSMTDAGWEEALRALETVSNSFLVPVNERLALVVRDTPQKRQEMQSTMAVAIPIPARISVQDAQELATMVQQTLEIRRIMVDPQKRLIFLRDQVTKAEVARKLLADLAQYRAQVGLEVEFVSVGSTSSLAWGMRLPDTVPLVNFGNKLHSTPSVPAGFARFFTFGGGATFLGLGIADTQILATLSRSSATTLLKSEVVALDGQPTTLHVGDRYPILAVGYFGATQGTGQVYTPPPTVNFEDLGLSLKVTPSVHSRDEITLDLETDFKVLGTGSFNGIPVISSRKFQGKVRLRASESAVVAGLVSVTQASTASGIAVPAPLFRQHTRDVDRSEVLLVLKPRLLSLPPNEFASPAIWIGTETRLLSPL